MLSAIFATYFCMFPSANFKGTQTSSLIKDKSANNVVKTLYKNKNLWKQLCKLIYVACQEGEKHLCWWKSGWHDYLQANMSVRHVCLTDVLWKAAVNMKMKEWDMYCTGTMLTFLYILLQFAFVLWKFSISTDPKPVGLF